MADLSPPPQDAKLSSPFARWLHLLWEKVRTTASVITFGSQSTPANTNTNFLRPIYKSQVADTAEVFLKMPFAGRVSHMYFRAFSGSAGAGTTLTLRKNGVDTALVISLAAGATTGSDTANSVAFAEGDELSLQSVHGGGIAGGIVEPIVTAKVTPA